MSGATGLQLAVVGSGYVGLVTAACLAEVGHSVRWSSTVARQPAATASPPSASVSGAVSTAAAGAPVRVLIIHPRDPAEPTVGGIQTVLLDFIKYAPADFQLTFAGTTADRRRDRSAG